MQGEAVFVPIALTSEHAQSDNFKNLRDTA